MNEPTSKQARSDSPGLSCQRATHWRLRTKTLQFGPVPVVMGIVNVTPNSFSDGGCWFDPSAAIEHGLKLVADGAEILDIGGESTRPYSTPVDQAEELRRVIPVVERLASLTNVPISIDTSKAAVAAAAMAAGAEIINDVTGLTADPKMAAVALKFEPGICAMHMQGTPQTMQDHPQYQDVVQDILEYLLQRKTELIRAGIDPDRICLDPGIGFGKTHSDNLRLIAEIERFHELGSPLLVGHSRKGFIAKLLGDLALDRDAGTLGISLYLAHRRVQILRVHEVAKTRAALRTFCSFA